MITVDRLKKELADLESARTQSEQFITIQQQQLVLIAGAKQVLTRLIAEAEAEDGSGNAGPAEDAVAAE